MSTGFVRDSEGGRGLLELLLNRFILALGDQLTKRKFNTYEQSYRTGLLAA